MPERDALVLSGFRGRDSRRAHKHKVKLRHMVRPAIPALPIMMKIIGNASDSLVSGDEVAEMASTLSSSRTGNGGANIVDNGGGLRRDNGSDDAGSIGGGGAGSGGGGGLGSGDNGGVVGSGGSVGGDGTAGRGDVGGVNGGGWSSGGEGASNAARATVGAETEMRVTFSIEAS